MKLQLPTGDVFIQFQHLHWNNKCRTECRVWQDQELLGFGEVKRYVKDPNDKSLARKNSLKKAIDAIPNRTFRSGIWKAYWAERERLTGKKFAA